MNSSTFSDPIPSAGSNARTLVTGSNATILSDRYQVGEGGCVLKPDFKLGEPDRGSSGAMNALIVSASSAAGVCSLLISIKDF